MEFQEHENAIIYENETKDIRIMVVKGLENYWNPGKAKTFIRSLVDAFWEGDLDYRHNIQYAPYIMWNTHEDEDGFKFKHHETENCILMNHQNELVYY